MPLALFLFIYLFLVFLSFFLGLHPQHMEVPRLGVPSYPTGLHHSHSNVGSKPHQRWIQATSSTYTAAHSNARSLTHWARPGIKPLSSWIIVRFISAEPRRELRKELVFLLKCSCQISFLEISLVLASSY